MIDKVSSSLFLGTAEDAKDTSALNEHKITHVLTTASQRLEIEDQGEEISYLHINVEDIDNQDILAHFDEALSFIEDAIKGGGNVLVHCQVGISRSAAFCVAFLMKRFSWSVARALDYVKASRPVVFPNEGFVEQLKIFESTNFKADQKSLSESQLYRNWLVASGNAPTSAHDGNASMFIKHLENEKTVSDGRKFRCGKCRHELFYPEHIQQHQTPSGEECCFGYLVDPLSWMHLDDYEAKISCPNCGEKLGNYCWGGRMCKGFAGIRCGTQIQPWVQLTKEKVREVRPALKVFAPPSLTKLTIEESQPANISQ